MKFKLPRDFKLPQKFISVITIIKCILSEIIRILKFNPEVFPELNIYDYEKYHKSGAVTKSSLRINLILDWIEPCSSVLDVGCGEGFIAEEISKIKKAKVYGVDVSKVAIKNFVSKGFHGEVRDIDQEGLNLKSDYDYILFIEVLEHLKWPHKVLLEACTHVKRGVIVTLPNSGYLRWRLQMLRGYFPRQTFTHLHFWSINDFNLFLKVLGLRVIDLKTELGNGIISRVFGNLFAYQQCWLIAPRPKT